MLWIWIIAGLAAGAIALLFIWEETRPGRDPDLEAARKRDYALEVLRKMQRDD